MNEILLFLFEINLKAQRNLQKLSLIVSGLLYADIFLNNEIFQSSTMHFRFTHNISKNFITKSSILILCWY